MDVRSGLPGSSSFGIRLLRRVGPMLHKERKVIVGSISALFAEVLLRLLEPWPLKFVIDRVILGGEAGETPTGGMADGLDPILVLTFSALALVAITGARAAAGYLNAVGFALIGNRVLTRVRTELYCHLQNLSLAFHNRSRSGDLLVRVIGDVGMLKDVAVTAVLPLFGNLFVLAGMAAVMFWLHWQLALLVAATLPLFSFSTLRLGRRIRSVARDQRSREGAMATTAAESIGAIKTVQSLSLNRNFVEAFASQNHQSLMEGVKAKRLAARLERTVDVLVAVATAFVLWFGARLVLARELTPGELLVFLAYLKNAFRPMRNFAKYTARLAKASAAAERVLEVLEQEPEVRDLPGAREARGLRGAVRFEGVRFAYEPGHRVLEDVDFELAPRQRVALVGPSGSGKSTLVGFLLRLYDPGGGRILVDGRDLRDYTLASLRAHVSVVPQDTLLFATSVRENIACGAPGAGSGEIMNAARLANAHEFIRALPRGYDTVVGERGATLSNGQRQRIAVARAAIRRTPILILDEPVTGLDEENARRVGQALDRLARGRTTFLITHDLEHAAGSDLILFLEQGRVVERGTHKALLQANGRYAAMYRSQQVARQSFVPMEATHAFAR